MVYRGLTIKILWSLEWYNRLSYDDVNFHIREVLRGQQDGSSSRQVWQISSGLFKSSSSRHLRKTSVTRYGTVQYGEADDDDDDDDN